MNFQETLRPILDDLRTSVLPMPDIEQRELFKSVGQILLGMYAFDVYTHFYRHELEHSAVERYMFVPFLEQSLLDDT